MTDTVGTLKTILVVEDTSWHIEGISEALEQEGYLEGTGYRVIANLTTTPEAIAAFEKYQDSVALIILDAELATVNDPESKWHGYKCNGYDLFGYAKQQGIILPPVIAHSSDSDWNDSLERHGAQYKVRKKSDMTELVAVVREVLPIE